MKSCLGILGGIFLALGIILHSETGVGFSNIILIGLGILLLMILAISLFYNGEVVCPYTDIEEINKRIYEITGIKDLLPMFTIIDSGETERDFTGDYCGHANIEFEKPISDDIFNEIGKSSRADHPINGEDFVNALNNKSPIPEGDSNALRISFNTPFENGTHDDLFWSITIHRNSTKGEIVYGRV